MIVARPGFAIYRPVAAGDVGVGQAGCGAACGRLSGAPGALRHARAPSPSRLSRCMVGRLVKPSSTGVDDSMHTHGWERWTQPVGIRLDSEEATVLVAAMTVYQFIEGTL
jgi:hypothetical protein